MMVAPVGIAALSWLSAGVSVDEAEGAGAGETGAIEPSTVGAGEPVAEGVESCADTVEACAGMFGSEGAASPAAGARADESSGDSRPASVGTGEFAGALALPEVAGATSGAVLKFGVGSAPAGPFAASGAEEVVMEVAMEPAWS